MWTVFSTGRSAAPHRVRSRTRTCRLEVLESRRLLAVAADEQYFIYRLNRIRNNPAAYAASESLPINLSGVASRPPLAISPTLTASSEFKANEMATNNYFAHQSPVTGVWPNRLARDQGYALPQTVRVGNVNFTLRDTDNSVESLAAGYATPDEVLRALIIDAGFDPPGHRMHLLGIDALNSVAREVGIGHANRAASTYRDYWAIHGTVSDLNKSFLTGVVFQDSNSNQRYDQGEGLGNVVVQAGSFETVTNSVGGWSLQVPEGTYRVTASGGSFAGTGGVAVTVGTSNIEVDFISGLSTGYVNFALVQNSAPVLDNRGEPRLAPVLANATNPPGDAVASLMNGGIVRDSDLLALRGVAVTGLTGTANGSWQYSLNAGQTWTAFGSVSASSARLLRDTDRVRFVPQAGFAGTVTLDFRAWDRTTGTAGQTANVTTGSGGATAFSSAVETGSLSVLTSNTAPVLNSSVAVTLPAIDEDSTAPAGTAVGSLLQSAVQDPDPGAPRGAAILGQGGIPGVWQYSTDQGATWSSVGSLHPNAARLLESSYLLRFVPEPNATGTAWVRVKAWDQTEGSGGGLGNPSTGAGGDSAYSQAIGEISITVRPINDAPTLDPSVAVRLAPAAPGIPIWEIPGDTVANLAGSAVLDVDGGLKGIAVVGVTGNGKWWFRNDGVWRTGTTTPENAWLLKSEDAVKFEANAGFTGTATLIFHAWDQTTGPEVSGIWANLSSPDRLGGTKAFSAASMSGSILAGSPGAPPTVSAITRLDATPSSAPAVRFRVAFSEPVNNVSAADFRTMLTGSILGTITSVTGNGATYTVTVGELKGAGSLGLGFDTSLVDIRDDIGNPLNLSGFSGSAVYEISRPIAPWQNPQVAEDVDGDAILAPIDALWIVNDLNESGARQLADPTGGAPPPYLDANGDGFVAPIDVLVVINAINASIDSAGEGGPATELRVPRSDLFFRSDAVRGAPRVAAPEATSGIRMVTEPSPWEPTDSSAVVIPVPPAVRQNARDNRRPPEAVDDESGWDELLDCLAHDRFAHRGTMRR